jgi:hypothetical protein
MSAERAPPAAGKRSPESPPTPLPPPQPKTSSRSGMRAPSGCSSSSGSPAAAGAAAAGASAGEGAAAGAALPPRRCGGRSSTPSWGPTRTRSSSAVPYSACTTGGGNVLGPAAPGAGAHCSLVEAAAASSAAAGPGAAAAAAGFFLFARFGASDARPDPVTVAVKAVTGQRVNDMVTTRSKAKHEAPQGAAAPQGAPLPHALTSCTARREPGRAVRFSPSRHRPPTTV